MLWSLLALTACGVSWTEAAALPPFGSVRVDDGVPNANHIFNAIHSSMRQWGSSVNHNGMSLFLAQVPRGTQFYHGSGFPEPVQGMEWLAFEPEHAINFARRWHRSGKPPRQSSGGDVHDLGMSIERRFGDSTREGQVNPPSIQESPTLQSPLAEIEKQPSRPDQPRFDPGWLHTYRTKDVLPLLYIDGMAAAKCDKGTLDTQDVLLLNATNESRGRFWEKERAEGLCKMAAETWKGKIKGFIRMEAGFEIIMCSFSEDLDFLQAVRAGPFAPEGGESDPRGRTFGWVGWEIKFVAARYDGIGGGRVKLDYDNFITTFNYDLDLFRSDDGLPRLQNLSDTSLNMVRTDIDAMVAGWDPPDSLDSQSTVDWQSVADMVVERYAKELKHLASGALTTSQELFNELELMLRVFVDSDARNTTAEVERCVAQFNPVQADIPRSLAGRAIRSVTSSICSTLFAAFDANVSHSQSMKNLQSLMKYLDWTAWKRCPECPLNKVCFIPVWPYGAVEDYDNPQCRNASELTGRRGYWDSPGPLDL